MRHESLPGVRWVGQAVGSQPAVRGLGQREAHAHREHGLAAEVLGIRGQLQREGAVLGHHFSFCSGDRKPSPSERARGSARDGAEQAGVHTGRSWPRATHWPRRGQRPFRAKLPSCWSCLIDSSSSRRMSSGNACCSSVQRLVLLLGLQRCNRRTRGLDQLWPACPEHVAACPALTALSSLPIISANAVTACW